LLAGPSEFDIQIAESQVERAKNELWALQKKRDLTYGALEGQIYASEQFVQIAEIELKQLMAGAHPQDIAGARAQVAQAQAGVQTAAGQTAQAERRPCAPRLPSASPRRRWGRPRRRWRAQQPR
jgi:hypothetical protein